MADLRHIDLGDGDWADLDMDFDLGTVEDLNSGDLGRARLALVEMINATNLRGRRGEPLVLDADGLKQLRVSDLGRLVKAVTDAVNLPLGSGAA